MSLLALRELGPLLRELADSGALSLSSELFKTTVSLNGDVYTLIATSTEHVLGSEAFAEHYRAHQTSVGERLRPLTLFAELPNLVGRVLSWLGVGAGALTLLLAYLQQEVSFLKVLVFVFGALLAVGARHGVRWAFRLWLRRLLARLRDNWVRGVVEER